MINSRILSLLIACICGSGSAQISSASIANASFPSLTLRAMSQLYLQTQVTGKTINNWSNGSNGTLNLATNQSVWTWPMDLSSVGVTAAGEQNTLIAPNAILGNNHYDSGGSITFCGKDGVHYTARFISTNSGPDDFKVYVLESNMPPVINPAWILPVGNYSNTLTGAYGFWVHLNTGTIDAAFVDNNPSAPNVGFANNPSFIFGRGQGATAGDSGSPGFLILNGLPVLLFATHYSSDAVGDLISDHSMYSYLTGVVSEAQLKIVSITWSDQRP